MRREFPLEADEQRALVGWSQLISVEGGRLRDYLVMLPNEQLVSQLGGKLNQVKYIVRMKQKGFITGASDLLLAYPVKPFKGLFIEMKRQRPAFRGPAAVNRAISPAQQAFGDRMASVGYGFVTPFGWEEARILIERYLAGTYCGEQMLEDHG